MIVFKRYEHTFKIRNDDWKDLRERFNYKNAIEICYGSFRTSIPCSLCVRYGKNCKKRRAGIMRRCPFSVFENSKCEEFFDRIFRKRRFTMGRNYVYWTHPNMSSVRRQLNLIQKIMDKIEEENNDRTRNSKNA